MERKEEKKNQDEVWGGRAFYNRGPLTLSTYTLLPWRCSHTYTGLFGTERDVDVVLEIRGADLQDMEGGKAGCRQSGALRTGVRNQNRNASAANS
jgi:hypothetical protein